MAKGKVQSTGAEEDAEGSPSKVAKTWSFTEKNRGPMHSFRSRGSASRQNSEGEGTLHSSDQEHLTREGGQRRVVSNVNFPRTALLKE